MKTEVIIFDIDGCLSDDTWRRKYLQTKPRNYKLYHEFCHKDYPSSSNREIFNLAASKADIVMMTGRPDTHIGITKLWLNFWGFAHLKLFMRPALDKRPAAELKRLWVKQLRADGYYIVAAYDDDDRNIAMFIEEGIDAKKLCVTC